jgi:hypothetical protein
MSSGWADAMHERDEWCNKHNCAPMSNAGNRPPKVHWVVETGSSVMGASPPGARIRAEAESMNSSRVTMRDTRPDHEWSRAADRGDDRRRIGNLLVMVASLGHARGGTMSGRYTKEILIDAIIIAIGQTLFYTGVAILMYFLVTS